MGGIDRFLVDSVFGLLASDAERRDVTIEPVKDVVEGGQEVA